VSIGTNCKCFENNLFKE